MAGGERSVGAKIERAIADLAAPDALVLEAQRRILSGAGVREVARVIERSPEMAAAVINVAGKVVYVRPGSDSPRTVLEAVGTVGLRRVEEVLYGVQTYRLLEMDLGPYGPPGARRRFMAVSEETARLGGQIAHMVGADHGEARLAGLMRGIGKPVLAKVVSDGGLPEGPHFERVPLGSEEERERFGVDHLVAGGRLARYWRLPERIARAIEGCGDEGPPEEPVARAVWCAVRVERARRDPTDQDAVAAGRKSLMTCGMPELHADALIALGGLEVRPPGVSETGWAVFRRAYCEGKTADAVATELGLTRKRVEHHLRRVYEALGVSEFAGAGLRGLAAAGALARERGYLVA